MLKKISLLLLLIITTYSFVIAQDNPVHFKLSSKKITECEYDLQFNATIDEPWHMYSLKIAAEDGPNPTVFTFVKSSDYEFVGKTTESKPVKEFDKVFEMNVEYFKHTATFTQRIKLKTDKKITITGKYEFQACTEEKCIFPPADDFEFSLTGTSGCLKNTVNTNSVVLINTTTTLKDTLTKADSLIQINQKATETNSTSLSTSTQDFIKTEEKTKTKSWLGIFIAGFIGGMWHY